MTYLKNFFLIFLFTLATLLIFEVISRGIISISVKNLDLFKITKNVKLEILDLTSLKFRTLTYGNYKKNTSPQRETIVWALGGSTTKGDTCKKKEINKIKDTFFISKNLYNWVEILGDKKKIELTNFGENGATSKRSLLKLSALLKKTQNQNSKKLPKIILWSNKINEHNVVYFSLDWKRNFNIKNRFFKRIFQAHYTLEKNSIFYQLLVYINHKIGKDEKITKPKSDLNDTDFKRMINFYNENTIEAFNISKSYGVEKFIILIQPESRNIIYKKKNKFDIIFKNNLKILSKKIDIDYIDLNEIDLINQKKKDTELDDYYFCDPVHKKHYLHVEIANYLNNKFKYN